MPAAKCTSGGCTQTRCSREGDARKSLCCWHRGFTLSELCPGGGPRGAFPFSRGQQQHPIQHCVPDGSRCRGLTPGADMLQAAGDPARLTQYEALLSPGEALQLAAAPTAELRRERLLARTLTRTVLSRYCHPICGCEHDAGHC